MPSVLFSYWIANKIRHWHNFSRFFKPLIGGLHYKHVTIINDASSIISEWSFKLIDDLRVVIYNCHRFIIQATDLLIGLCVSGEAPIHPSGNSPKWQFTECSYNGTLHRAFLAIYVYLLNYPFIIFPWKWQFTACSCLLTLLSNVLYIPCFLKLPPDLL